MSKYIIKNCECKVKGKTTLCVRDIPYKKCENITDCVMKQIVELCKNAQSECSCKNAIKDVDCFECTSGGRAELGTEILQLLQIEDVE